jgi:hypothetical protein
MCRPSQLILFLACIGGILGDDESAFDAELFLAVVEAYRDGDYSGSGLAGTYGEHLDEWCDGECWLYLVCLDLAVDVAIDTYDAVEYGAGDLVAGGD